eukprot:scaffold128_cov248-Pinguiococcus_pyrenoidosus.AAC.6
MPPISPPEHRSPDVLFILEKLASCSAACCFAASAVFLVLHRYRSTVPRLPEARVGHMMLPPFAQCDATNPSESLVVPPVFIHFYCHQFIGKYPSLLQPPPRHIPPTQSSDVLSEGPDYNTLTAIRILLASLRPQSPVGVRGLERCSSSMFHLHGNLTRVASS